MRQSAIKIAPNTIQEMQEDIIETISSLLNLKSYKLIIQHMTNGEN